MIFTSFERQIAWRYLWPKKKGQKREGFITLIGALAFLGIMLGGHSYYCHVGNERVSD